MQEGADLFLTNGGQNSFMESLNAGVPLVVCPGSLDSTLAQKCIYIYRYMYIYMYIQAHKDICILVYIHLCSTYSIHTYLCVSVK